MDGFLLLAARAATARIKLADDSATAPGANMLLGGTALAAGGFGGRALGNRHIAAHPIGAVNHEIGRLLSGPLGGSKTTLNMPSRMGAAKFMAGRGKTIGLAGLGLAAAGIPAFNLGRDVNAARAETAGVRADMDSLRQQLAAAQARPVLSSRSPEQGTARRQVRSGTMSMIGEALKNQWARMNGKSGASV